MAANVEIVIKTIDKSTKETKEVSSGFKDMAKGITLAVAGIATAVIAMKQAIQLGAEGAKFDLLGQSAKNLGVDIEALQASVGGTISEFAGMNAVNTLVAGTSGNLQEALVGNADKLLQIAKAANAVNPALGTTNFLYESLGKGIKRASPMILDNLGIIVKLEQAQTAMAQSLGKTVSELTNEEKQMAILNETIKAGNVLIGQASGLNTTAADAYAKLGAQGEDAANRLKAAWGIAIAPIVGGLADMIENSNNAADSVNLLKEAAESGKISWEEYSNAVAVLNVDTPEASQAIADLVEKIRILEQAESQATDQSYLMSLGIGGMIEVTGDLAEETEVLTDETEELASAAAQAASKYNELFEATNKDFGNVFEDMRNDVEFLAAGGGGFAKLETAATGALVMIEKSGALGVQAMDFITNKTDQAIIAYGALQVELGNTTPWEAARSAAEQLDIPIQEALNSILAVDNAAEMLDGLTSEIDVFVNIITTGSMPSGIPNGLITVQSNQTFGSNSAMSGTQAINDFAAADGAFAKAGEIGLVGEEGPELVKFGSNARVFSNSDSQNMMGGGNSGVQHGEMMDMFATFAEQIAESVSTNQGAL